MYIDECSNLEECDWEEVTNWEGDPDVVNGTHSWTEYHCRTCGAVEQDKPNNYHKQEELYNDDPVDDY